jgi:hypothetical protein
MIDSRFVSGSDHRSSGGVRCCEAWEDRHPKESAVLRVGEKKLKEGPESHFSFVAPVLPGWDDEGPSEEIGAWRLGANSFETFTHGAFERTREIDPAMER